MVKFDLRICQIEEKSSKFLDLYASIYSNKFRNYKKCCMFYGNFANSTNSKKWPNHFICGKLFQKRPNSSPVTGCILVKWSTGTPDLWYFIGESRVDVRLDKTTTSFYTIFCQVVHYFGEVIQSNSAKEQLGTCHFCSL